jgi:hypothetical protein
MACGPRLVPDKASAALSLCSLPLKFAATTVLRSDRVVPTSTIYYSNVPNFILFCSDRSSV